MKFKLLIVIAAVGLSACGGSKTHSVETNPQVQQAEATAQKAFQECLPNLSKGRKAFKTCLSKRLDQQCVQQKAQHANFLTHSGRQRFEATLAGCVK